MEVLLYFLCRKISGGKIKMIWQSPFQEPCLDFELPRVDFLKLVKAEKVNCSYLFPLPPVITAWVNMPSLINDREEDVISLVHSQCCWV